MSFLDLVDVRKAFGTTVAVERFTMNIERGEFVSFLGPSGCGKTTTLRMIAGFELPSEGTVTLNGADITYRPANRRNVGMMFQSYALFPNMTVGQNVAFGMQLKRKDRPTIDRRVAELLKLIGLPDFGGRYPWQLSGGQQQRVALARALAIEPQVLLLDEPLSALDAKIRVALRNEIRNIQRQLGITTIYVTHDQEEALALSDRVVVMSNGRIEQIGTPLQIYNFPQTSFVATFVGTLNLLTAEVVNPATGQMTVDGQQVSTTRSLEHYHAKQPITIALRPEVISLDGAAGTTNQLRGTVEDLAFLGGIVRLRVRLSQNQLVFDMFNSPTLALPKRGDAVALTFPAESCHVMETTAEASTPPLA